MEVKTLSDERKDYFLWLQKATDLYLSKKYHGTIYSLASLYKVCYQTLYDRVKGHSNPPGTRTKRFALSHYEELLIASNIKIMGENKTPLNQIQTRTIAGLMRGKGPLSDNWMKGFLQHFPEFKIIRGRHLDMPRVKDNAETQIVRFFDTFFFYAKESTVGYDSIFNIDEAGFKIGQATDRAKVIMPGRARHVKSYDSSELVTVLEVISKSGTFGYPLFTCKGVHVMTGWLPKKTDTDIGFATSSRGFINTDIFLEWIDF